jgi:hypothetical protein
MSPVLEDEGSTVGSSSSNDAGDAPSSPLTIFQELVSHLGPPMVGYMFKNTCERR